MTIPSGVNCAMKCENVAVDAKRVCSAQMARKIKPICVMVLLKNSVNKYTLREILTVNEFTENKFLGTFSFQPIFLTSSLLARCLQPLAETLDWDRLKGENNHQIGVNVHTTQPHPVVGGVDGLCPL